MLHLNCYCLKNVLSKLPEIFLVLITWVYTSCFAEIWLHLANHVLCIYVVFNLILYNNSLVQCHVLHFLCFLMTLGRANITCPEVIYWKQERVCLSTLSVYIKSGCLIWIYFNFSSKKLFYFVWFWCLFNVLFCRSQHFFCIISLRLLTTALLLTWRQRYKHSQFVVHACIPLYSSFSRSSRNLIKPSSYYC
jgi:hypothetical protein